MDDPIHSFVEGAENGSSNDFPAVGLKKFKRSLKNITYDISDLYNYIDNLCDLCCLVFQPQSNSSAPPIEKSSESLSSLENRPRRKSGLQRLLRA